MELVGGGLSWMRWMGCSFLLWVSGGSSRNAPQKRREQQHHSSIPIQQIKERERVDEAEWSEFIDGINLLMKSMNERQWNKWMNGAEGSCWWRMNQLRPAEWPMRKKSKEWNEFDLWSDCLLLSLISFSSFFFHQTPQSGVSLIGLKKISWLMNWLVMAGDQPSAAEDNSLQENFLLFPFVSSLPSCFMKREKK